MTTMALEEKTHMSTISLLARNCTLFTTTKALDEDAYRQSLQRFVDFKIGPFLASGGSGEANALSRDEVRRVYQIGVDVCRGKVPVYANMPEVRSAQEAIEFSRLAIAAGVDIVNLYGPASLHGYRPTDPELTTYFHDVQDGLTRDVGMNVPLAGSLHTLGLGATGLSCNQTNVLPRTCRQYVDCYERGDLAAVHQMYADLHRFTRFVEQWRGARWQKMALMVFKLPGGEGGLRKPYLMPTDAEVARFTRGLLALGLAEIDELARAAGLGQVRSQW